VSEIRNPVSGQLVVSAAALLLSAACLGAESLDGLVDPTAPINVNIALEDVAEVESDAFGFIMQVFESYTLNSVLIRSNDRIAVVNNQRVRVGGKVGAATVKSIDATGVLLDVNGETQSLSLYGEPVKTLIAGEGP
jgi:hypothetical protein